ncbi:MAG TPA: GIY-YIG nuclease family protein [Ktedonobacterales bacterium]|jgi:hypothetical protein|nr:GIY-YIG nuclease family protein [Ktedonobacterales bacterium]
MSDRKALSKDYKERRQVGGVYTITNTRNGKYLLGYAVDLASVRNRFQFAVTTGSAVDPRLRADWQEFGAQAFTLDILEELERGPDQMQARFMDDLKALAQLRRADLDPGQEY